MQSSCVTSGSNDREGAEDDKGDDDAADADSCMQTLCVIAARMKASASSVETPLALAVAVDAVALLEDEEADENSRPIATLPPCACFCTVCAPMNRGEPLEPEAEADAHPHPSVCRAAASCLLRWRARTCWEVRTAPGPREARRDTLTLCVGMDAEAEAPPSVGGCAALDAAVPASAFGALPALRRRALPLPEEDVRSPG